MTLMARLALALLAFAWVASGLATVFSTFLTARTIGAADGLKPCKLQGFSRIRIWPILTQVDRQQDRSTTNQFGI